MYRDEARSLDARVAAIEEQLRRAAPAAAVAATTAEGTIPVSILGDQGDMIAGSGPATAARVPGGANGRVLTADSSVEPGVSWQDPPVVPADLDAVTTLAWLGL